MQAALQVAHSQGKDTAGFKFYPVCERQDPDKCNRFHGKIPLKTLKEVKQACTMYGSIAVFMLGLLQSVVRDTAMPQTTGQGWLKYASLQVIYVKL
jgi:hypothetical protein